MDLSGKSVIVAGGFGGIGFATCENLLSNGIANLAILDLANNQEKLDQLRTAYPSAKIIFTKADASQKLEIENAFKEAIAQFSFVDVVIISVGIMNEQNPKHMIDVNLVGTININLAALEYMSKEKKGRGGTVVSISSVLGLEPDSSYPVYCATNHGIYGFVRSLGTDQYFNVTGIKFYVVCPGPTETDLVYSPVQTLLHHLTSITTGLKGQSSEECAQCLVESMKINKNGSIWIIENAELSEVTPITYYGLPNIRLLVN